MLRGCSGFYSYAIYEHLPGWPAFEIGETRITFKLRKDKYQLLLLTLINLIELIAGACMLCLFVYKSV